MSGKYPVISVLDPVSQEIILGLPVFVRTVKAFLVHTEDLVFIRTDTPEKINEILKEHEIIHRVKLLGANENFNPSFAVDGSWHLDPDFVAWLIKENKTDVLPHLQTVSSDWFQDLKEVKGLTRAETKLFNHIKRKTEGWVAPRFNKPISFYMTRRLLKTAVTPNQITFLNLIFCLPILFLLQSSLYPLRAMGAVFMQFSSIIDGCDGEVAKLKFKQSKSGGWFDTIADDLANNLFFVGIFLGLYWQNRSAVLLVVGITSLLASMFATFVIYHGLITRSASSNAKDFTPAWQVKSKKGWFDYLRPLVKRDFFILILSVLVLLDFRLAAFCLSAGAMYATAGVYAASFLAGKFLKNKLAL